MMNHNGIKTRRGKFSLLLTACSLTVPFAVVAAKDLTWTGSTGTNSNAWDNALTDNWVLRGTTTTATFADGDNVLIESGKYVEPSLMMTRRNRPGDIVFNIAAGETFSFGWNAKDRGLDVDTKSFTKRGKGTLLLRSDLSGSEKSAGGDTTYGNAMTCGVDIVEGEIACKNRNSHNYLGPRTIPYWVYIRDGAALSFLEGNQTGASDSSECGIMIQLDAGARLNHCTNFTAYPNSGACLNVNTLKLCGGDIVNGAYAFQDKTTLLGGRCMAKIFNTLWFSGNTPHAFGFQDNTYEGYKHYSLDGTLKGYLVSLNSKAPVEIRVDDIDGGDGVDAYMSWQAFTWGTNSLAGSSDYFRCDIVKTGSGTLVFPSNKVARAFKGDFTVKEGKVWFQSLTDANQNFFVAGDADPLQTITVSTNATLVLDKRNITAPGDEGVTPNIKIVVDHGTLKYRPGTSENKGTIVARDWVFDDATLDISNLGNSLYFKNSLTFRGTRPLAMLPDENISGAQSVLVHNGTNTTGNTSGPCTIIDVADMTGDGRTDVVMGYRIDNGFSKIDKINVTWTDSGFIKTGAGTFSVASQINGVSGVVTVSNGTMRVDGVLTTPSAVNVVSGAFLGGTGTVKRVSMESGSGFAAPVGQDAPLTVDGALALPATGVVDIANLEGAEEKDIRPVKLATATSGITGTENLDGWSVKVDGITMRNWKLKLHGGVLCARPEKGFVISFR